MKRYIKYIVSLVGFFFIVGVSVAFAYAAYRAPTNSGLEAFFGLFALCGIPASIITAVMILNDYDK